VDTGHPVSEAIALTRPVDAPVNDDRVQDGGLRDRLLAGLVRWDRTAVDRLAPELSVLPFARALDDVYLPILRTVGDEWAAGRISVAQEHYASAWVREQMLAMFHALGSGPQSGPRVVCAMAPGELHELGLLAVSIKLALQGFRVIWLGADLPIDDLVEAVRDARPRLVCLSVMMPTATDVVLSHGRRISAASEDAIVAVGGAGTVGLEHESGRRLLFAPAFSGLETTLAALRRSVP
jgi:hypothetical protein